MKYFLRKTDVKKNLFIKFAVIFMVFFFKFFPLQAFAAKSVVNQVNVAFAGSMSVVMTKGLEPVFTKKYATVFQGRTEGAYALARLLAAKEIKSDVFISVGEGPVRILQRAHLVAAAMPISATQMVLTYSPKSQFAPLFQKVAAGKMLWYKVLMQSGFRFGRTDPLTDSQGRNVILTFLLAERYYKIPDLVERILGSFRNPRQIFPESSLLNRLRSGKICATVAYESTVQSWHLPIIFLPQQINLSNRSFAPYNIGFYMKEVNGNRLFIRPEPLIFYAVLLKNAPQPKRARQFFDFLQTTQAQQIFKHYGYDLLKNSKMK